MVEWDELKRLANLAKHGIDFVGASRIFDGFVIEAQDDRKHYGERRMKAYGVSRGEVLCVIYTLRGRRRRIISARRANRHERENYRSAQAQSAKGPD